MSDARQVIWRRSLDGLSLELASVALSRRGPTVAGTVLIAEAGAPLRVEYQVVCDRDWRTREVRIQQSFRGETLSMTLAQPAPGEWVRDGRRDLTLDGCTDVDLGVTPSTNLLPIRRLRLEEGSEGEILAAWVRFPEFTVTAAPQGYTRLAPRRYRYRSLDSGFEALMDVDEFGLPVTYGEIWERIAVHEGELTSGAAQQGRQKS